MFSNFYEKFILNLSTIIYGTLWVDKSMLIFELIISLLLLFSLIMSLFKYNYLNKYTLTFLNIIILIAFITLLIQDSIYFNCFNRQNAYTVVLQYTTDKDFNYILGLINAYINIKLQNNAYFVHTVSFYNHNFIFNLFLLYVKNFNIIIFILCLIFGYSQRKTLKISYDKFVLILFPLLFCNSILILTQDLIIGYLAIEFQNLCLIFLMSLKKKYSFTLQLSVRFFILNSVGSLFILLGIVLLYTIFYTTNISDIYILLSTLPIKVISMYTLEILLALTFIIIGLFFKLLVGPFGLWLVEIYEYSLTYGIVIFSILPKIGYFMFLFHIFLSTSYFLLFWDFMFKLFGIISIIIGTFGALSQISVKRLLAFSSLNYFGYILLSFIGFTVKSFIICILYFFMYVLVSFYIWFIILYLEKVLKRNILLVDLVILRDHYPILAFLLSLSFFLLAGLPPFYLFVLKFATFYIFIYSYTNIFIILSFLICSFISIYYYLNLIKIIHFNPSSIEHYKIYPLSSFSVFLIVCYGLFVLSPIFFIIAKSIYYFFIKILYNYSSKIIGKQSLIKIFVNLDFNFKSRLSNSYYIWGKKYNALSFFYKIRSINPSPKSILKYQKVAVSTIVNFIKYLRIIYNYDLNNLMVSPKISSRYITRLIYFKFILGAKSQFKVSKSFLGLVLNHLNSSIVKDFKYSKLNKEYMKYKEHLIWKNHSITILKIIEYMLHKKDLNKKSLFLFEKFKRTYVYNKYYKHFVFKVLYKYYLPRFKKGDNFNKYYKSLINHSYKIYKQVYVFYKDKFKIK